MHSSLTAEVIFECPIKNPPVTMNKLYFHFYFHQQPVQAVGLCIMPRQSATGCSMKKRYSTNLQGERARNMEGIWRPSVTLKKTCSLSSCKCWYSYHYSRHYYLFKHILFRKNGSGTACNVTMPSPEKYVQKTRPITY